MLSPFILQKALKYDKCFKKNSSLLRQINAI